MEDFKFKNEDEYVSPADYNRLLTEFNARVAELHKKTAELDKVQHRLHYYEALVEAIPMPVFAKDGNARFCILNKAYEDFFVVKKDNLLGTCVLDMEHLPKEDRKRYQQEDLHAIETCTEIHYETSFQLAYRQVSTLYWSKGFAIPNSEDKGLVGVIVDISKQKNLECRLEENIEEHFFCQTQLIHSVERLQLMLDTMPLSAQMWSKDHKLLMSSKEMAKIFDFKSQDEFIRNLDNLMPYQQPDGTISSEAFHKILDNAFEKGYARVEWTFQSLEGELIPFDIILNRRILHDEEILLVYLKDLREHYANLEKLKEAHEYSRTMLDESPFGTIIFDEDYKLVACNKAMAKMFGLNHRHEFIEHFHSLYPEQQPDGTFSLEKMQTLLQNVFSKGFGNAYWTGKDLAGEQVPLEGKGVCTKHNGQNMVVVFFDDLREAEKNAQKVLMAENRTHAILEGIPMGINLLTSDMQIIDCNEEAVKHLSYDDKDDFFNNFENMFPETQTDGTLTAKFIEEKYAEVAQSGHSRFEMQVYNKYRELVPFDITFVHAHLPHEEMYIAYTFDLRETKAMLHQIELAKEVAEKSALAKSEFLANMSHEIRTPMNGILGLLHILSGTKLDSMQQDYMQKALFSTNELLRIINDILDFSKIEAGKLDMEMTVFTIHDVCAEIESLFSTAIEKKSLYFHLDEGKHATTTLLGDPLRLKQVLLNLVGNAIKFTGKGGVKVSIESSLQENDNLFCRFAVEDTGIGLSKEQISRLFDAFSQADNSVTRKYGGTGLGLAISKRIVSMMQGDIWVESVPGQGSIFFFTAYFDVSDDNVTHSLSYLDMPTQKHDKKYSGHILLVEDNHINQIIAEELLKEVGYTIDIANDGQEALFKLEENSYDLVLMDIQMPNMDGLTATKIIRQNPKFKNLPIVAMSAHAMTGDKEKSLKSGMNDHITKPISPNVLYNTIVYWMKKDVGKNTSS